MRISVVVADSIRDAVNARTASRDGGVTFTPADRLTVIDGAA